nr:MAG TPA: hypothetical protein [Caudoviricetes sp.]
MIVDRTTEWSLDRLLTKLIVQLHAGWSSYQLLHLCYTLLCNIITYENL